MRKKMLAGLLAIAALGMVGCSQDGDGSSVAPGISSNAPSEVSSSTPSSEEPAIDFTIQTSDNGLTAETDSYTFAKVAEDDSYPPEASFRIRAGNTWNLVTGLNDNYTKIIAEDEDVLPEGSVSLDIITDSEINGSSGSNEIAQLKVVFDREKAQVGTTKLRIEVRAANGSSTLSGKTCVLCVNVEVKEFGTIEVDTYDVSMTVDISPMADVIAGIADATEAQLTISDNDEIYGYSADDNIQIPIDLEDLTTIEVPTFRFAADHVYDAWIFINAEDYGNRKWLPIEAVEEDDSSFKLTPGEQNSTLEVFKDVSIEAVVVA